jgi:hypothetical protein
MASTFAELIADEMVTVFDDIDGLVNPDPDNPTEPFYYVLGLPADTTPVKGLVKSPTIRISVLGDNATNDLTTEQAENIYTFEIACLVKKPKSVPFNKERIVKIVSDFWVIDVITQIRNILRIKELLNNIELETEKIETIICSNADYIPELLSDGLYSSGRVTATITTTQVKPERRI